MDPLLSPYLIPGPVLSDNNSDLEEIQKKVQENLSKIPNLPTIPNIPELPDLTNTTEDAKKVFREKCIKVSGSDAAFEEAQVKYFQKDYF